MLGMGYRLRWLSCRERERESHVAIHVIVSEFFTRINLPHQNQAANGQVHNIANLDTFYRFLQISRTWFIQSFLFLGRMQITPSYSALCCRERSFVIGLWICKKLRDWLWLNEAPWEFCVLYAPFLNTLASDTLDVTCLMLFFVLLRHGRSIKT